MKRFMSLLLIVTGTALLGCTAPKVESVAFKPGLYAPTTTVAIIIDRSTITERYEEIGLITVDDRGWGKSEAELIEHMRREAQKMGADAIILEASEQRSGGYVPIGDMTYHVNKRISRGVAIKYTDAGDDN